MVRAERSFKQMSLSGCKHALTIGRLMVRRLVMFHGKSGLTGVLTLVFSAVAHAQGFAPVPVDVMQFPPQMRGTVDQELMRGQLRHELFTMTAPARKRWRIAYLFPHLNDPYWLGCAYGVVSEARRLRVAVDIIPAEGYDDLIGQLREMNELVVTKKYDAIVLSPISLTGDNLVIRQARKSGIPVFELANDSTSKSLVSKVTTSMDGMGENATHWMMADARRRGLKSVNVALLPGPMDAGWVQGEVKGTLKALRNAPIPVHVVTIRYGDSERIIQTQLTEQILAQYGRHLDYILGCTGCAPAAVLPVRAVRLNRRIRIVAYDLTDEIAAMLRRGEIRAAGDTKGVSQARVVTDLAVAYLENPHKPVPDTVLVGLGMVDTGNLQRYPIETSIAPQGYTPVLSWAPGSGVPGPKSRAGLHP